MLVFLDSVPPIAILSNDAAFSIIGILSYNFFFFMYDIFEYNVLKYLELGEAYEWFDDFKMQVAW